MKKIILTLLLLVSLPWVGLALSGCTTSQTATAYTAISVVEASAKTAVTSAALARHNNQITEAQWQAFMTVYDKQFLPAYNLALAAAGSNVTSAASPDLVTLAAQLASLLASYLPTK